MLYFNTKHFGIRSGEAHSRLSLRHFMPSVEEDLSSVASKAHHWPIEPINVCLPNELLGGLPGDTSLMALEAGENEHRSPVRLLYFYVTKW
ncbi:unnamed protein product [Protopolystoma xenopodis]|uniref:ZMYM2-like/QRICH1 C-terminal domain-containing protein n=1 Tax=Protopolystoma xenopodis TaxID=117903 RepID=A0A448X359_9PLAT|nr:unnamed protein product [Protopolystoma xenopodis]